MHQIRFLLKVPTNYLDENLRAVDSINKAVGNLERVALWLHRESCGYG
jgi:hypothetical protein